ncbi:flagellar biosynthesis anti-sigma factor FlgM [Candidatus Neomarinimicrobiota bacterium]
MVPIKNIGNSLPQQTERLKERDRIQPARPENTRSGSNVSKPDEVTAKDSVSISSEAKQLAEKQSEVSQFQNLLQGLGPADSNRIEDIRTRVNAGEFDSPEVLAGVSEAISRLPQFSEVDRSSGSQNLNEATISAFAERIRSGQYQTDGVLQQVASGILSDIGLG